MFSDQEVTVSNTRKILQAYLEIYPEQNLKADFEKLFSTKKSITSRQNFYGHITASAIVLDQTLTKVLLIEHKKLGKLIQPGGHVDETDESLFSAANREVIEETGFNDLSSLDIFSKKDIPIDIDIHLIPENIKKNEPEHLHFDFRYLFILNSDSQGNISEEEIDGYKFVSINELFTEEPSLSRVAKKVVNFLN